MKPTLALAAAWYVTEPLREAAEDDKVLSQKVTMTINDGRRILPEVVRGLKPWPVLQRYGFKVNYYDGRWEFGVESAPPLSVSAADVSGGLLALSLRPSELREWASFMLAASSLVDLGNVEDHDLLLEALWDASFGEPVKPAAYLLANRLREEAEKE